MLKSMIPRSVCLFLEDSYLQTRLSEFFGLQGWDVDVTGPNDLLIYDGQLGLAVVRSLRKRGDETPALLIRHEGQRLPVGALKYASAIEEPFTPDRLRDACGALLRQKIKLVLKRRAAATREAS